MSWSIESGERRAESGVCSRPCGVTRGRVIAEDGDVHNPNKTSLNAPASLRSPLSALRSTLALCSILFFCGFRLPVVNEGELKAEFVSSEERLAYDAPLIGTLEVTSRAQDAITLPNLTERFRGFTVVEDFEAGSREAAGKRRSTWRFRLTPAGSGPYRLMPFVMEVRDTRTGTRREVLTQAINFPEPMPLPAASGTPECDLTPEWVAPSWQTIALWVLSTVGGIIALIALIPLFRRVHRTIKERQLSPEERAKLELARLLAEGLLEQGRFKPFFFGLTGVVRRYYERSYGLRATRQTTEEFLRALTADPRFTDEERTSLSNFLSAADRIKFAGQATTREEADAATTCAREAITRPRSE